MKFGENLSNLKVNQNKKIQIDKFGNKFILTVYCLID